jgi:sigma-B regulation protein RsbU (phosphoserine phosphatase)
MLAYEHEARSAARELTERYEEINLLYFISEILASVLSIPDAAHWILAEVADVLGARRASLWVYHPNDNQLHLAAAVGEEGLKGPISIDDPDSATAWVFREKEQLNIERGTASSRLPRLEPRPGAREAFLSVPINYTPPGNEPRTVGVITLVGRRTNVRFNAGDARLLAAIASQIGAAALRWKPNAWCRRVCARNVSCASSSWRTISNSSCCRTPANSRVTRK